MDSLITAAARALAGGDPLGALNRVALRDDAPALALRGIAMAQLGDLVRAKALLKQATRAFAPNEKVARARCVVAEAEIAFASRDLSWPVTALDAARITLEQHGDSMNAAHARYLAIRRHILLGQIDVAEIQLAGLDPARLSPVLRTTHELVVAGTAIRRLRTRAAGVALERAANAARIAGIPALTAEVESAARLLTTPAARLMSGGNNKLLLLRDVEALQKSIALVVDACRNVVHDARTTIPLATRPVLFSLARTLAEAWPRDVARHVLIRQAFRAREADESHRARLRVEIGRLRRMLRTLAGITATGQGFALIPHRARKIVVLAQPIDEQHGSVLAILADGEAWSSSALALTLGASQRTVQRALDQLAAKGKVQSFGRGRARRWITPPVPGFTTTLLLPDRLPVG